MPRKRTPGNLSNGVPLCFAERIGGFADYISVVLMESVLLHLKFRIERNEKDNFNAIQHFDQWSSHLTLDKIHASTVLRLLNRCLDAVRLSGGTRDCNATLRPPVREYAEKTEESHL